MTPRQAVFAAFIAFGVGFGTWAGTIATVASRSGLSPDTLGLAITGFIAAALAGMAAAGALSRVLPLKTILLCAIGGAAVSLPLLMQAATPASFVLGLCLYGLMHGAFDGSMNAEGTAVEHDAGRPILSGFHAAASFALAPAALLGSLIAVRFGTQATALIVLAAFAIGAAAVLSGMPKRSPSGGKLGAPGAPRRFSRPIVLLGLIVGISIAGETAAAMFSAPALARQAPELAGYAGFGATAFALCQAVVRSTADILRRRLGDLRVIEISALVAAAGFALVATSSSFTQSALGFALVGAGTACLVPCGFSLAPVFSGIAAAQALGILAVVTALPRIPAPLAFGQIADRFSFGTAFALNIVLFLLALLFAFLLRRMPQRQTAAAAAAVLDGEAVSP